MTEFSNYTVRPHATVREVIEVINRGVAQWALVTDGENKLLGVITDGDIRRAMLSGVPLTADAQTIMVGDYFVLRHPASEEDAIRLMRRETLRHVPVVDADGRLTNIFLLKDLLMVEQQSSTVVIMAGGEGMRLRPLTQDCPKPMLQIGGKPILEIILENCIEFGFKRFYISVNYLKKNVKDYFGDGSRWNVSINYLEEQKPSGTGGALSLLPQGLTEPLLVINGDVLSKVDFKKLLQFHYTSKVSATVCVREHSTQIPFGVVQLKNSDVVALYEKPVLTHLVNAGIYVIQPSTLKLVPRDTFFHMPQLLENIMQNNQKVSAYPIHEFWLDIGLHETLQRAQEEWF